MICSKKILPFLALEDFEREKEEVIEEVAVAGTGKSLSEALIFASTNPQNDDKLFSELQVQNMKI